MECKRAEPKDATSAPAIGQAFVDQATAGAMVLAQGPDGSVSLVPAHALAAAGHGAALVYPQAAAAGVGLMSPADIAAYRAAAAGVSAEMLQAGAIQQAGVRFMPSAAAAATNAAPGSPYFMMGAASVPGATNNAGTGNGYIMMSNTAGGNVIMQSALQAQGVMMPRSGLAGAGMFVPGPAGGSGYLLAGGNVPQYMMGYPAMSNTGLQFSGTMADIAAAYNAGNPYAIQMPSGTAAMYAFGKADQAAGLVGSLGSVADATADKSGAATGAAQLASSYGIGLVGADSSDDGTARAGVGTADNQMVAAQMLTGAAGNRLAAVSSGYYFLPGGTAMYAATPGAAYAVASDPSTQTAYITASPAQQSAVIGRMQTAASVSAHGYHPYRR